MNIFGYREKVRELPQLLWVPRAFAGVGWGWVCARCAWVVARVSRGCARPPVFRARGRVSSRCLDLSFVALRVQLVASRVAPCAALCYNSGCRV